MNCNTDHNFIAIDFETATSRRASIYEVGICVVREGEICETRSWLVQPQRNVRRVAAVLCLCHSQHKMNSQVIKNNLDKAAHLLKHRHKHISVTYN